MTRGFLLGKFMPPHAGHLQLWRAAMQLVDQLTILVCWLPDDPIPGPMRLKWVEELAPGARVVGFGEKVPQAPAESPDFWSVWRQIVKDAHPETIDLLFAGEFYGAALALHVGGRFVGLGGRIAEGDPKGVGSVSASAIRRDPRLHWRWLPPQVRSFYTRTVCLHGVESTGKTSLAERLGDHFGTVSVPEYGRLHCEIYGVECTREDLLLIGRTQQALIDASKPWSNGLLITDTDALMTAAWSEMMIGEAPSELSIQPKADLYLLLEPDAPWIDDGTRLYPGQAREAFHEIATRVLADEGVRYERISGDWDERFRQSVDLVKRLLATRSDEMMRNR